MVLTILSTPVVLKIYSASESPEKLIQAQIAGFHACSYSIGLDGGPEIYFLNKFPGDANVAAPKIPL